MSLTLQHKRGTTAQNDAYTGRPGEITVDTELNQLRLHDGVSPGGHAAGTVGEGAGDDASGSAGPGVLAAGDPTLGYYGFVPASELITGDALAAAIGLSAGTSQFSDAGWFKYSLDGRTCFGAKRPLRYNLSWQHIYQAGAVYGTGDYGLAPSGGNRTQDAVVRIDGVDYRVRLFRGANVDPIGSVSGYDIPVSHGSEWNRVFYRLHDGVHTNSSNSTASEGAGVTGSWGSYSDADLHMHSSLGNGTYCWTQESEGPNRVRRGHYGVSHLRRYTATTSITTRGWRPVLEPVS